MSWVEDEQVDAWSLLDIPNHVDNEEHWKQGIHFDSDDNEHKIAKMADSHLLNVIRYFKDSDTTPLIEEAKRRNIWQ